MNKRVNLYLFITENAQKMNQCSDGDLFNILHINDDYS